MKVQSLTTRQRLPSAPVPWGVRDYPQIPVFAWLVLCPLCFGGVDLWARAIGWLAVGISLVLMAWLDPYWFRAFRGMGWIVGLFLAWILFATVPLPASWIEAVAPARISGQSHTILAGQNRATIAYMPGKTLEAFLTLVSGIAACALFAHWARHHEGRRRLIWLILFSALGVMLVAWLNAWTPGHIYWRKIETPGFMGPFTGRNIFADYLVLSSLVGIGFVIQRWWPLRGITHKSHLTWVAVAITACAVGWVMASASRGACLSWVAGLLMFGVMLWRVDEKGQRSIGVFIGLTLVAALTVIYAQTLIKRIDTTIAHATLGRAMAWKESLKMGFDHGWTGIGLGNFPWVFPRYQPGNRAEIFTHPENEYLEWWNETGWIGSFLILLLLFRVARKLAVVHKWKDIEWQAGGIAALGALLIHSFFDFPIHIQANALLAIAILGLVWGNLMRHPDEMPSVTRGWLARLVTVLGGSLLIVFAALALRAEWQANRGDYAGASALWPLDPKFRYPQVQRLLNEMEFLPAHRMAEAGQRANPVDWKLYYLDGWALAPLYRWTDDSRAAFDKAVYWSPAKSETARKAGFFFWPRRPEIAVDFWNRSLEYEAEQDRAYYLFLERTRNIAGQEEFARVLAGNNVDHLAVLADWMAESGSRDKLTEIARAVLQSPPPDPRSREKLARLLLKLGLLAEADALLADTPHKTVRLKFYQAEVRRQQKRFKEALDLYQTLTAALPEGGKIPRMASLSLETLERRSGVEADSIEIQSAYAWKLMKSGQWARADKLWDQIGRRWTDYADAHRFRAACLEAQNQLEGAALEWKTYYTLVLP